MNVSVGVLTLRHSAEGMFYRHPGGAAVTGNTGLYQTARHLWMSDSIHPSILNPLQTQSQTKKNR